jgi:hypothetical protein
MVKTRSSPVISKIFVMFRSLQTSESWPSFVRRRLTPAHEHAERRRVDERRRAQVDDHVPATLVDHLEQLLLELRRRVEVHLACQRDHVLLLAQLLGLDVEVHLHAPGLSDSKWPAFSRTGVSLT